MHATQDESNHTFSVPWTVALHSVLSLYTKAVVVHVMGDQAESVMQEEWKIHGKLKRTVVPATEVRQAELVDGKPP